MAKVALFIYDMHVSTLQGGFEPILKSKLRAPSDWGVQIVKFHYSVHRLVVRKQIRSQWSISTIFCICTIAYEDCIIYSSVSFCVVCRRYYVAPLRIFHIYAQLRLMTPFNAKWHSLQCYFLPRLIFLYFSATSYGSIDYY